MSLGGFWDALRGANGLGGQIWAVSLIAAIASGIPLLIYLTKRLSLRSRISKATPGEKENVQEAPLRLRQAVQRLNDDFMPVLRQEAQKLDDLEKENEKLRALSEARSKRQRLERSKRKPGRGKVSKVITDRPIRRKSEM